MSEICRNQKLCQKTVSLRFLNMSEIWQCFLKMFQDQSINVSVICQLSYIGHISDTFINLTLTVFWHNFWFWHISETFLITMWQNSYIFLNMTVFRHISDTFQTFFWQFFATDTLQRAFRQFLDIFPQAMIPKNFTRSEYKCVIYLSVELVLTDFQHI